MENTLNHLQPDDERDLLIGGAEEVASILTGKEKELMEIVRSAYMAHGHGESSLPHSVFLGFPDNAANRIIALPAYLGGNVKSAGVKWIASFPGNLEHGLDRASAVLILNSMATGRPKAILEGSLISAKRTAASAALAACVLRPQESETLETVGIVGCGLINLEVVRFLLAAKPEMRTIVAYDLDLQRAHQFQTECESEFPGVKVRVAKKIGDVLAGAQVISFATTAREPHVESLAPCAHGALILHVSLRDLSPRVILSADNIVDDIDHVCRSRTSLDLAAQQTGGRGFIRCTLGDILNGQAAARQNTSDVTVFSPFGLGILDLAVGEYVLKRLLADGKGRLIPAFLPNSWARVPVA
jgi:N-[(2S)-2-amino-2-carboxyethyl]-L-glutamate dehydrogenase